MTEMVHLLGRPCEAESLTAKLDAPTLYRWRLGSVDVTTNHGTLNRYRAQKQNRSVDCIWATRWHHDHS